MTTSEARRGSRRFSTRITLCIVGAAAFLSATAADAIPAFTRKYGTSCQTCHVAYPKLNTFGQAFRLLGYHMPGETEDQVKEPELPLGSSAYKRLWPKTVWPGAIPHSLPIALAAEFLVQNSSRLEDGEEEKVENDFLFPSEVALLAAGSAGDHISYFGELVFRREVEDGEVQSEAEVEHIDLRFIRPIKDSTAFNVKIGSFQPELVSTFDHARRLTVANYDSMFGVQTANPGGAESVGGGGHGGAGGVTLPEIATGFEFYGIAKSRFTWSAGLVSGDGPGQETFDGNNSKDVYGRFAYKWGGLALDGSNAATYAGSAKNWQERSFAIGVFGYWGDSSGILRPVEIEEHSEEEETEDLFSIRSAAVRANSEEDEESGDLFLLETDGFSRYGLDFNWYFDDFHLFGAYLSGDDSIGVFGAPEGGGDLEMLLDSSGDFSFTSWFVELDVVFPYPWLVGAFRYEGVDLPKVEDGLQVAGWERATLSMTGLIRANVKATLEYTFDLNESSNYWVWANFGIAF